ncbi:formate dehydrogenase accessory protein FdhE [Desulfosarcina sp.]|uniref:formate dehydrogenase accessory protein FdhE n=1 Tax=Desulfosarcina sp. TaxID=2027861 RepID=UPI003970DF4B
MTSTPVWNETTIKQAISQVTAMRPAYTTILGFYGPVFVAQSHAAEDTCPEAIRIDRSLLEMQLKEGFSLIEPAAFTVDVPAAEKLLVQICRIAVQSGEKLGGAGEVLTRAMNEGVPMAPMFNDVLDDKGRVQELAKTTHAPADMLSLLLYLAVKPSIEAGSRQLAVHLASSLENRGNCPVCGRTPILGELDAEGKQWVHCGLCWHRWPAARMACPFCQNRDSAALEYFFSDDEPEFRVNLCGGCKRYLKVVDTRKMDRRFYAPLEQVTSLHLDLLATEKGYIQAVTPAGVLH